MPNGAARRRDGTLHFGAKNQKRNSGANGGGEARRVKQRTTSLAGGYDGTVCAATGCNDACMTEGQSQRSNDTAVRVFSRSGWHSSGQKGAR